MFSLFMEYRALANEIGLRYSDSDVVSYLLDRQYLFATALCSFLVLTSLALFTLLLGQGINIARNITSNERLNRSRYPWMKDAFGQPFNHYDQGILKNVLEFWHVPGYSKDYFQEFHGSQRIENLEIEKQNSEKFRSILPGPGPPNGSLTCDITINSDPKISPYSEPKENCDSSLDEEILRSRPPSPQKKIDEILMSRRPSMVTGLESDVKAETVTVTHQMMKKVSIPTLPLSIPSSSSYPFVSFSDPPSSPLEETKEPKGAKETKGTKEAKDASLFHSRPLSNRNSNLIVRSPSSSPAPSISPFSSTPYSTPKPSSLRLPLSLNLPTSDSKDFDFIPDSKSTEIKSPQGWLRKSPSNWSRLQSSPDSKSDSQRTGIGYFSEKTAMSSITLSTAEFSMENERRNEDYTPREVSSLASSLVDGLMCDTLLSSASTSSTSGNIPKICPESSPQSADLFIIPAKRRRHEME